MNSTSIEDIQTFLDASIQDNCEGLMVKTLEKEASYEPSKRSRNWLKVFRPNDFFNLKPRLKKIMLMALEILLI